MIHVFYSVFYNMLKIYILTIFWFIATQTTSGLNCNVYYKWQDGDYPYLISTKYGITLEHFFAINNYFDNLYIYTPGMLVCVDSKMVTSITTATTTTSPIISCGTSCIPGCIKYYQVKPGDYAYQIAIDQGLEYGTLLAINNNFNNQYYVTVGMVICISMGPTPSTTSTTTTTAKVVTTTTSTTTKVTTTSSTTTTSKIVTTTTSTTTKVTTMSTTTTTAKVVTTTTSTTTKVTTTSSTTTTSKIVTSTTSTTTKITTTSTTTTTTKVITTTTTTKVSTITTTTIANSATLEEFQNAVTVNGYPKPSLNQYLSFVKNAEPAGGITTKRELAMFLGNDYNLISLMETIFLTLISFSANNMGIWWSSI